MTTATTNRTDWQAATAAVDAAESILIVTHFHPDGDAIGSLLGLGNALIERGRKVDLVVDGGVPDFLSFVPGQELVRKEIHSGTWDLMISVDCSDEERSGKAGIYGRKNSKQVINLDHHPTNTFFGDIYLVAPEAASATEVVYDWLEAMQQPVTQPVAVPLLVGLVTDTLGFRTSNVKSRTLKITTALMDAGASLTEVTARTLGRKSYNMLSLWREAFSSVALEGQIISGVIRQVDLKKSGVIDMTDGGLVGLLITVDEAMISVIFKELETGLVELSFRSKPGYDVASVALDLGGGGHKQASGATIPGPLDAAIARVMPLLKQAVAEGELVIR